MNPFDLRWIESWAWSLPLIVFCVVAHVFGLGLINRGVTLAMRGSLHSHRFLIKFSTIVAGTALTASVLHGLESIVWAMAYWLLGAIPDYGSAVLYSLGAMTTYGNANEHLENRWRLMGALEALNGVLLFGLTTAFLFAMLQHVWWLGHQDGGQRQAFRLGDDRSDRVK